VVGVAVGIFVGTVGMVGAEDGLNVGEALGLVGRTVGELLGPVGRTVGTCTTVGAGVNEGAADGFEGWKVVGLALGAAVGSTAVGFSVGDLDGLTVGCVDGPVGLVVGTLEDVGSLVGLNVGTQVGALEGLKLGATDDSQSLKN